MEEDETARRGRVVRSIAVLLAELPAFSSGEDCLARLVATSKRVELELFRAGDAETYAGWTAPESRAALARRVAVVLALLAKEAEEPPAAAPPRSRPGKASKRPRRAAAAEPERGDEEAEAGGRRRRRLNGDREKPASAQPAQSGTGPARGWWADLNSMFSRMFSKPTLSDKARLEMIELGRRAAAPLLHEPECVVFVVDAGATSIGDGIVFETELVRRSLGCSVAELFPSIPATFSPVLKAGMLLMRTVTRSYVGRATSKPLTFATEFSHPDGRKGYVHVAITAHTTSTGDMCFVARAWYLTHAGEPCFLDPNATASSVEVTRIVEGVSSGARAILEYEREQREQQEHHHQRQQLFHHNGSSSSNTTSSKRARKGVQEHVAEQALSDYDYAEPARGVPFAEDWIEEGLVQDEGSGGSGPPSAAASVAGEESAFLNYFLEGDQTLFG
jgi:hypothetical protein